MKLEYRDGFWCGKIAEDMWSTIKIYAELSSIWR